MSRERFTEIVFKECRNEDYVNEGYTAYLNGKVIAEVSYGPNRRSFVTKVSGEKEELRTKTRLEVEAYLAKKHELPFGHKDPKMRELAKKFSW